MLATTTRTGLAQQQRPVSAAPRPAVPRRAAVATRASSTSSMSSLDMADAPAARPQPRPAAAKPAPAPAVRSGHKGSDGVFAPAVNVTRSLMGDKEFNKFRGQAISLHSQVIKAFSSQFGVNSKQAQGLIRLAKKNGEWLGFLA